MKWESKDIEMFLRSKEYVDTVVVPLLPVSFGEDINQAVSMTEFITLLVPQLERQFKGRILMLPGVSYLRGSSSDKLAEDVKVWETELFKEGFKHIFYVTSDSEWKKVEGELEGTLIWLPSLPLQNMDENYKNSILEDQVKQLLNLFVQAWK